MIAAKIVLYWEAGDYFKENHPLSYRFWRGRTELLSSDLKDFIQLQVCSAWFRRSAIVSNELRFDPRVKPTFEDGHFIYNLLIREQNSSVVFLPSAIYFYRKRFDSGSLVGSSTTKPEWYGDQLRYGILDLAERAEKRLGSVPDFLQRAIIYETKGRHVALMDLPLKADFLTAEQRSEFWSLMEQIFSYIDVDTIEDFSKPTLSDRHKFGLPEVHNIPNHRNVTVLIRNYNPASGHLQLQYFARGGPLNLKVRVDGKVATPIFPSKWRHSLLDKEYFTEYAFWVRAGVNSRCEITINGKAAELRRSGDIIGKIGHEQLDRLLPIPKQKSRHRRVRTIRRLSRSAAAYKKFNDCWLFLDRPERADDNAEHLYRYLLKNGRADNAYFLD